MDPLLRHILHVLRDGEVAEAEEAAGVFAEELRLLLVGQERALDDEVVGHLVGDGRDGAGVVGAPHELVDAHFVRRFPDGLHGRGEGVELVGRGFRGIKIPAARLLLPEGRVRLDSPEMMEMFRLMEDRDMILHVELADGDLQVAEMESVIAAFPRLRILIGHFGMVTRPGWMEQIRLARHPNVYVECGGITWLFNDEFYPFPSAVQAIREAADEVGFDKLMWGSDYPRTITAITYKMSYDFITKSSLLTDAEKAAFLGENARRFFGFGDLPVPRYVKNMSE